MNLFDLFVKIAVNDQASGPISAISHKLDAGLKKAAKVGVTAIAAVGAAVGTVSAAFIKGASDVAQYGDNIDKMSQKMGLSAQAYQEWDFIMQHSGTSMETLKAGMKTLANAVDSGNKAFERLGISQKDIASMSQEELFAKTIEQLQKVENETERTYLAGQLLGRGATELGALLNTSAEDTEAMRKQVHELGGVMSDEAVKAAAAYQDSLQNMQTAFSGIRRGMLSEFLPSMVSVMDGLALIFSGNDSGIEKITEGVNGFAEKLLQSIPKILEFGTKIVESISTAIIKNIPLIANSGVEILLSFANGLLLQLPNLLEAAVKIIDTLIVGITKQIPQLSKSILEIVIKIADTISKPETLNNIIKSAITLIMTLVETLINPDFLTPLIEAAITIIETIANFLLENLPILLDAAISIVMALVNYLLTPENLGYLVEAAVRIIVTIAGALINSKGTLLAAVGKLIVEIFNAFINFDWNEIGRNIVDGIKNGISKAWKNLKKWFKNLFGDLIGIAKKILGIASPSKVFRAFGQYIDEGLQLGMEDGAEDVFSTVRSISSGIADNFGDDYDYGITTSSTSIGDFGGASARYGYGGSQNVNVTVGIDSNANAMGLARALLPFLKVAEKEAYA